MRLGEDYLFYAHALAVGARFSMPIAISQGLGDKAWCSGNHFSLADIAVGCALGWLEFRFPEIGWRETHPNLARHMDKLSQRQSFIDTVPVA